MNKPFVILSFIFAFLSLINFSNATVLRVNNNNFVTAPYTNFTAAYNAASNGDTIYLEGSSVQGITTNSYGNISLSKPLTIFGPGYFLNSTSANRFVACVGQINFNAGSSGSLVSGLSIGGNVYIYTGNITFKKNLFLSNYLYIYLTNTGTTPFGNILISQNWMNNDYIYDGGSTNYINNITICNNFIYDPISLSTYESGIISNNVLYQINNVTNFNITNNILNSSLNGSTILTANYFSNNIGSGNQFPLTNNNKDNVNWNSNFVGGGNDTTYRIAPYSAAYHAGSDSTDCGMFGGSFGPYVPSGFPAIPEVYYFYVPGTARISSGMNVTVKAKTH